MLNVTHDPAAQTWVPSGGAASDFPIQNLPFGVFRPRGSGTPGRVGVAIGVAILDLPAATQAGLFDGAAARAASACDAPSLNPLMALGAAHWSALRSRVSELLREGHSEARRCRNLVEPCLLPQAGADLLLPAHVGDYTDFYASIFHATNVGRMLRPDSPLLPNYRHVPVGYHGRASSIVASGTPVRRPCGQTRAKGATLPRFGSSRRLDYELEVGVFVGPGNPLGEPIAHASVESHLFGACLVNDWSARDIQQWEYQPLGPFLAKSFATSISPWVVTLEALEPFRVPAFERSADDPAPLWYLDSPTTRERGGIDLRLSVYLQSALMRDQGLAPARVSSSNLRDMYWTMGQLATHHASNGCNLRPGDLLASGTVSGAARDARGCLLELTWRGAEPISLPSGETRTFLEDGDEVILRGWCERDGAARIGFGECRGRVLPAPPCAAP